MQLADYLARHSLTPSAFAERIGAPVSVVTRFLRGERGVSLETAVRIERETGGAVKPKDLLQEAAS